MRAHAAPTCITHKTILDTWTLLAYHCRCRGIPVPIGALLESILVSRKITIGNIAVEP